MTTQTRVNFRLYVHCPSCQALNTFFPLASPILPQYMICHNFLWIQEDPLHTCHMYRSSLQMTRASLLLFPLFLNFMPCLSLWSLSLASTTSADWTVTKLVFYLPLKILFLWGWLGMEVCRVMVLRGEGKSITCSIWGVQKVRMVEHKICTCYGICMSFLFSAHLN